MNTCQPCIQFLGLDFLHGKFFTNSTTISIEPFLQKRHKYDIHVNKTLVHMNLQMLVKGALLGKYDNVDYDAI